MGPAFVKGSDAGRLIEAATVCDFQALKAFTGAYSVIPNEKGGMLDDTVISNFGDGKAYIVFNASRKEIDKARFEEIAAKEGLKDVRVEMLDQHFCLLALQGPRAEDALVSVLPSLASSIKALHFMHSVESEVAWKGSQKSKVVITRCGYTGEDGFEILVPNEIAEEFTLRLLEIEGESGGPLVLPAGLGARDILRTEAGLCLYGNDIDESTTPLEAGIIFTITKRRRLEGGFPGADVIQAQIKDKSLIARKRVGFLMEDKSAIREG